jgi:hypothetical protein
MASTLPPPSAVNTDIPIVTSNGGSASAYKDPNSPESIMKKTHAVNVQSKVDSKFDVASNPYEESFLSNVNPSASHFDYQFLSPYIWVLLILFILFYYSSYRGKMPLYLYISFIGIVLILALYQKVWESRNNCIVY